MWTAKYFNEVAKILKSTKPFSYTNVVTEGMQQWEKTVIEFSSVFKISNPLFNAERFLKACGWSSDDTSSIGLG